VLESHQHCRNVFTLISVYIRMVYGFIVQPLEVQVFRTCHYIAVRRDTRRYSLLISACPIEHLRQLILTNTRNYFIDGSVRRVRCRHTSSTIPVLPIRDSLLTVIQGRIPYVSMHKDIHSWRGHPVQNTHI
jgi:hypothetical protein